MTKNQKTFAYVGGGILLLLLLFRKKGAEKSLEEGGAPAEQGGSGGGGGGFGGGIGGGGSLSPVVAPIVPSGYIVVGQGGLLAPLSGLNPNKPSQAVVPISNVTPQRETPPTPPSPSQPTDILGAPVMSASTKVKFADFDGDANFQDALL